MVSFTTLLSPTLLPITSITNTPTSRSAATLTCAPNSTLKTTTDCTLGFTYSFCYSAPPPITCSQGYYPSIYHPGHCLTVSTCFPVPTTTSTCSNGYSPYTTTILYNGTIDGHTTLIEQPLCNCIGRYIYRSDLREVVCMRTGYSSAALPTVSATATQSLVPQAMTTQSLVTSTSIQV